MPGNLSVLLDGAADRWLFRLRYFPQPQMFSFGQQGERYQLKPGDNEIKVNVRGGARRAGGGRSGAGRAQGCLSRQQLGLDSVAGCMNITMTVGGRDCHPNVLKNEVTCRVPRDVDLTPAGAPVQVGTPQGNPVPRCPRPR